ncbi:glutamine--fructose-6-phosphate aminotransferase [Clostridium tepidiprofundi DSM 19306]|uniref:Glutamine--fructose-6-phosphate aminotransferase [isomerizing] n=1 Tax=Clostridium tepidiprofundi DSM 19306 TaxID=1121338 RepID=A0A151B687_9CLOT|nr:glutamine--fructose-6-phosphate transaminase (isomerizing) [Clostridium tepidiprofundi]KYH35262.1 glutamine--fructose-6-phosphate aminotransferase [Clostridium tepidiprofundi DSM 19306]
MCGIVGYFGNRRADSILLQGLEKLEYRGYDSAGVSILDNDSLKIVKCKGRIKNLRDKLSKNPLNGTIGIGHTRWATHGEPSDLNAHPHTNEKATISVVHNGIIENYIHLKEWLCSHGYNFSTDTDTEVIPNLIDYYYNGSIIEAVIKATQKMEGSYAIGVISSYEPDKIVAVRKDSPLIIGAGKEEAFIASDVTAVLNYTRDVYYLDDKEFAIITKEGVEILSEEGETIEKELSHVTWNAEAAEKGGYKHFMLKEIHEQPKVIRDTMTSRIVLGEDINLDGITISNDEINNINKIYIVACGTAYHAGIVGKYVIEKLAKIPVEVDVASEFRYREPMINENTLMIVISQSGETADTLAALRLAKKNGARVIAITNVMGSTISREANDVFYTWAGPEIAVASTKAYVTQLIAIDTIALYLAKLKNSLSDAEIEEIKEEMLKLPEKAEKILESKEVIQKFAAENYMHKDMFFLGRGLDYAVAMEGSLKLKEISYIHSEAYPGGELKHGPIALIEDGTVVIVLATQEKVFDKMVSNIKEVVTRGGKILAFAPEGHTEIEKSVHSALYIPETLPILYPVISVIPLQLLSYYMATAKGCDVDKPRNLAKSVTVE